MVLHEDYFKDLIGAWLEHKHEGYTISGVVEGTYGLVWVLEASLPNVYPRGFAGKGMRLPKGKILPDTRELFEREIRLWMHIPPHFNTLAALGVDFVPSDANTLLSAFVLRRAGAIKPEELADRWRAAEEQCLQLTDETHPLPIVLMPLYDGSLRNWVNGRGPAGAQNPAEKERSALVAIGQLCNGLKWLYGHGLTGHGDLKPENVLYKNYSLEPGLLTLQPKEMLWRVVIADLGWADAWSALGMSDRAWRPYLAPERANLGFDGQKSDAFATGVIFFELLAGTHPAGETTEQVGKWKCTRWFKWANSGARKLAVIEDGSVRSFLDDCLAPNPQSRPSPEEILAFVSSRADKAYGIPLRQWLDILDGEAKRSEYLHPGWACEQIASVSKEMRGQAIRDLRQSLSRAHSQSSMQCKAEAVWLARSLSGLLSRGDDPTEWHEAHELILSTCRVVLDEFHSVDWRKAMLWTPDGTSGEQAAVWLLEELVSFLHGVAGDELPEVVELRHRISQRRREVEGSV